MEAQLSDQAARATAEETMVELGGVIYVPTAADFALEDEFRQISYDAWSEDVKGWGIDNPDKLFNDWRALVDKYSAW